MTAQFARAPHTGGTSGPVHTAPNAALLIDFDNVTMGIRSDLSKELKSLLNSDIIKGKVAVQRAYADWRRYPQYIVPLSEASVDLIFAPAYGSSKKNATDIRLAIDALELVFTRPEIGTFILLSGDSDFSSLVLKLKEYGKYVIGVGIRESASDLLVQNCDEYYSYSVLSGLTKEDEELAESLDPWLLVEKSVRRMAERGDVMRSDRLKQVMLESAPNFNEKELGYSKFSRFLSDAVARDCLHLKKLDNGQWEVAPVKTADAAPAAEAPQQREASPSREDGQRSRGRGRSGKTAERPPEPPQSEARKPAEEDAGGEPLPAAYALLCRAVGDLSDDGVARDSDVKRRMLEIEPGWDESTLGFSKFSRFLRQAHDAEVINLHKAGNGTYEIVLPDAKSAKPAEERRGRKRVRATQKPAATPAPGKNTAAETDKEEPSTETEPKSEPVSKDEVASQEVAARGPRSAMGIGFRRGTRGRNAPAGPPPVLPGQAVKLSGTPNGKPEPAGAAPPPSAAKSAGEASSTASKERSEKSAEKKSRRSRGRTGRTRGKAAASAARAEPVAPELDGLPTGADSVATYLSSRYKGVGGKTAETVIEAFGAANVFHVLHNEADRVREALGARRAETLLSAWRADLEHRRLEAAAVVEEVERAADAKTTRKPRSGSRKSRGSTRKAKARSGTTEQSASAAAEESGTEESAESASAEAAPRATKVDAASSDQKPKKGGGRSRSRRGGRSRGTPKAKAGGS